MTRNEYLEKMAKNEQSFFELNKQIKTDTLTYTKDGITKDNHLLVLDLAMRLKELGEWLEIHITHTPKNRQPK